MARRNDSGGLCAVGASGTDEGDMNDVLRTAVLVPLMGLPPLGLAVLSLVLRSAPAVVPVHARVGRAGTDR